MQEPGRRPAPPFAGVDLRRPKGYPPAQAAEERPAQEAAPAGDPCPRCQSRDTKFCYYNNYNTSQPRHFCRSCRRYWTKGGSLRNVPVGGGTRKASSSAVAKNSKRRRVAPAADPAPATDADTTADVANDIAPATPAPSTEPPATVAAEEPATATVAAEEPAAPTAPDGGCADTSVALELAPTDVGDNSRKEELPEPAQFEWPSGCDLGSYWGAAGVFSDTDSQMFLNLP